VVAHERSVGPPGLTSRGNVNDNITQAAREALMGNKADRTKGTVKRATGAVTGDDELKEQGRRDQAKGNMKASAKKAKEAVKKL
jgi:uncharacterized protein YjbJ (UPF0337 family)